METVYVLRFFQRQGGPSKGLQDMPMGLQLPLSVGRAALPHPQPPACCQPAQAAAANVLPLPLPPPLRLPS